MDIDNAVCASVQTSLNESIVFSEIIFVDISTKNVVRQELPSHRQTENVEAIIIDEVLHLSLSIMAIVLKQRWPSGASGATSVGVASKVKSSDVDTCEAELACRRRWR